MSKKRKTRKEKERAVRHKEQLRIHVETPIYSLDKKIIEGEIEDLKTNIITPKTSDPVKKVSITAFKTAKFDRKLEGSTSESSKTTRSYLIHDIRLILSASGIVIAFDLVLSLLLSKGILRLTMFGY